MFLQKDSTDRYKSDKFYSLSLITLIFKNNGSPSIEHLMLC